MPDNGDNIALLLRAISTGLRGIFVLRLRFPWTQYEIGDLQVGPYQDVRILLVDITDSSLTFTGPVALEENAILSVSGVVSAVTFQGRVDVAEGASLWIGHRADQSNALATNTVSFQGNVDVRGTSLRVEGIINLLEFPGGLQVSPASSALIQSLSPSSVKVAMGTKDTEVRGCLVTNPCDAGILSRGAALTISDCELYECEDAVRHTYGDRLTLVRCQIRNIDGDGICSIPKISLLEDVTFESIGRHEVMCKAGVLRKVTSPVVEPPPPPPVPVSQLPYGPAG